MIWLTWRQSRLETLIGAVALALVAMYIAWNGYHLISAYHDSVLPGCAAAHRTDEGCRIAAGEFIQRFSDLRGIKMVLLLCLPYLIGALLAAPTILDFEQGTYRLAWVQSVTRRRWLATRIGYGLAIASIASGTMIALFTWWRGPIDALEGRFNSNSFDFEGPVPIAYTVFAFALCLTAGTLLRRSVPAMGIGLVGFLAMRAVVSDQLRPHYLAPTRTTWDPAGTAPAVAAQNRGIGTGAWILNEQYVNSAGRFLSLGDETTRSCMEQTASKSGNLFVECLRDHGVSSTIVYHSADRFWIFEAIETALFLGVSAGLLALTAWWVIRRIA